MTGAPTLSTATPNVEESTGLCERRMRALKMVEDSESESDSKVTTTRTDAACNVKLILLTATPVAVESACKKLICRASSKDVTEPEMV